MKNLGELLMVGVEGTVVTSETSRFIKDINCGGVILFKRNYENPKQLKKFIEELNKAARKPLIISVDQEGGRVARLSEPFTSIPPMADVKCATDVGRVLGLELSACGMNLNFAPVMDVATNPDNPVIGDRSFSSDANEVAKLGAEFIKGIQSTGVAACAKHFPGHGDTEVDSHFALPVLYHDLHRLKSCEFIPFVSAIKNQVASIMTAHILLPNIDPDSPATISHTIINNLLRKELGFKNLVITDDMTMKGIADDYPVEESSWRSIRAGADVVLVCHGYDVARKALDGLKKAIDNDWVEKNRVRDALTNVSNFKSKYCQNKKIPPLDVIGCKNHADIVASITK